MIPPPPGALSAGKLAGTVHGDESTWCLVEKGTELQILLSATTSKRWPSLLEDSD